jgi:hypothetical protein
MSLELLAQVHRDELIAEAKNQRMADNATTQQPPLFARLLGNVGEALTHAGELLQERAQDAHLEWELKQGGEKPAAC